MNRRRLLVLALFVAVPAATFAAVESDAVRSFAIYPEQKLPVSFSHELHLAQDIDCDACHGPVSASVKASDLSLPAHPECELCHDIEAAKKGEKTDPPAGCGVCHQGAGGAAFDESVHKAPLRIAIPEPNLKFNHKVHLDKKIECSSCHGDLSKVGLATRQQLPKMETCLGCHDNRQASAKCETCHLVQPNRKLQMEFANTRAELRPQEGNPFGIAHGPRFEFEHAARASVDSGSCLECHAESYCLSCHDGRTKPLNIHPNDYLAIHPVQARVNNPQCDSCHRRQTFCAGCHERVGIGQQADPVWRSKNARVHPPAEIWVLRKGPQHHGLAASRDIGSCISCHREESCMACHSERGTGRSGSFGLRNINPHPPDFAARCGTILQKNARGCLKCHTSDSPELARCR